MAFSCSSMTSSSSNNTATSITSSSSSSSSSPSSPSSYFSSPCPSPPHPHAIIPSSADHHSLHDKSKVSVPFLWEEKPGISKPNLQSSHNTANILYNPSSTDPPINCSATTTRPFGPSSECIGPSPLLPPPPARLSHAFLSQPTRLRRGVPAHSSNKLLSSHSFSAQGPQLIAGAFHSFKKPSSSKYDDSDDPFFLALKACTIITDSKPGRFKEKASFDGFQSAFRGLFKSSTKKDHKSSKGSSTATKDQNEDMSYNQHLYRRELLVAGSKLQANVNGLGAKAASEIDSDTSSQDVLAQRKDKHGTDRSSTEPRDQANVLKKAHKLQGNLVIANKNPSKDSVLLGVGEATQGKPLQGGVARKAIPARKEELADADEAEQVFVKAYKARNSAKVVDAINVNNNKHSNPGILTDLLGCRSGALLPSSLMKLGPTNNIHPSFIFPRKLFTYSHD